MSPTVVYCFRRNCRVSNAIGWVNKWFIWPTAILNIAIRSERTHRLLAVVTFVTAICHSLMWRCFFFCCSLFCSWNTKVLHVTIVNFLSFCASGADPAIAATAAASTPTVTMCDVLQWHRESILHTLYEICIMHGPIVWYCCCFFSQWGKEMQISLGWNVSGAGVRCMANNEHPRPTIGSFNSHCIDSFHILFPYLSPRSSFRQII